MITRVKKTPKAGRAIQKFLLYLILVNFGLMWLYIMYADELTLGANLLLTFLLIVYNLLLCQLVVLRARRVGDGYIIYMYRIFSYNQLK
jgi:membrane protein YdbS with pleckstrin-like domain